MFMLNSTVTKMNYESSHGIWIDFPNDCVTCCQQLYLLKWLIYLSLQVYVCIHLRNSESLNNNIYSY